MIDVSLISEQKYTTNDAPPEVSPQNIRGGGGKVGNLQIFWDPLPPEEHNGQNVGYIVYWKKKQMALEDKWEEVRHGRVGVGGWGG